LWHFVVQHWLAVSVSTVVAYLTRNRYQKGLSKYPGPFLASLTDWWRFYDVYKQRPETTHRQLHAKYGDVVRLGPNSLSFADPKALKSIYGPNKGFVKVGPPPKSVKIRNAVLTDFAQVRLLCRPAVRCEGPQPGEPLQHDGQ